MSFQASSTRTSSLLTDRRLAVAGLALLALVLAAILGIAVGTVYIAPGTVVEALLGHGGTSSTIVNDIRLPRVLIGAMVGASLAMSGAILQGVTRNPLADPHIFGISSGAGVVAVTLIVFYPATSGNLMQPLVFGGGLLGGGLTYVMAWRGGIMPVRLALAGVAVTSMLTAVIVGVLLSSAFAAQIGLRWLIGSMKDTNMDDVGLLWPYFVAGSILAVAMSRQLNVIALGDEVATSLGQRVESTRLALMAVATLLAASAVSIAGLVGFVGLIVPHFVRLIVGSDYRFLVPISALVGAVLIVLADTLARTLLELLFGSPQELPVGVITAMLGGPVFIMLVRGRA